MPLVLNGHMVWIGCLANVLIKKNCDAPLQPSILVEQLARAVQLTLNNLRDRGK